VYSRQKQWDVRAREIGETSIGGSVFSPRVPRGTTIMGYTFQFLKPEHPYWENWCERRRLRRRCLISSFLFPIAAFAVAIPFMFVFRSEIPCFILFAAAMAIVMRNSWQCLQWPCPRCGRPFSRTIYGTFWFHDQCHHCELDAYAPCDPTEQQREHAESS
jgi:hypothetical protein